MKELLIKIKALFEGQGTDQAKAAVEGIGSAADKAGSGGLGKLQGWIDGAAAKAGILGGAVSALGAGLISFAANAVSSAVGALQSLVGGFISGIKGAADFADTIGELATRTGQSIETVLTLSTAFKNAGMSGDSVATIVARVQKSLAGVNEEGQPTAEVFARIGLSVADLRAMSADKALEAIGGALNAIPDPSARAAAGMEIFGRAWASVSAVVLDGQAFAVARQQLGDLAIIIQANKEAFGTFADAWARFADLKMQQFFTGAAAAFAGDMQTAATALNGIDLTKPGMTVGIMLQDIRAMVEVVSMPLVDAWENVNTLLDLVVGKTGKTRDAVSGLITAVSGAINPVQGVLNAIDTWTTSATTRAQQQLDQMKAQAEAAKNATTAAGATAVTDAGATAQTGIAQTAAEGSTQLGLTAEQMKAAVVQLAQEMAKGNADVVTPAMQALTGSVQEGFARIAGEVTSVATTLAESQRAQIESNQQSIREAVAGLGSAQESANAETAQAIQAAVAAVERSNASLAASVASAISSMQAQLAAAQAQIQALAGRV